MKRSRFKVQGSGKLNQRPTTNNEQRVGVVVSVNISAKKSVRKKRVGHCKILASHGLEGDAHAGGWHRQVSLLAEESIKRMQKLGFDVGPGDFAENITTRGVDLLSLPVGARLKIGEGITLEVTQHGKTCHTKCAIYYRVKECIMPKEGIFAKVLKGGKIKIGDEITIFKSVIQVS
ncbi:MAG: MOSC domain-containing protein [Actinomycetota bacterium]|nr:MOSC domain-containing protein [Actinomycetota bacterium]